MLKPPNLTRLASVSVRAVRLPGAASPRGGGVGGAAAGFHRLAATAARRNKSPTSSLDPSAARKYPTITPGLKYPAVVAAADSRTKLGLPSTAAAIAFTTTNHRTLRTMASTKEYRLFCLENPLLGRYFPVDDDVSPNGFRERETTYLPRYLGREVGR